MNHFSEEMKSPSPCLILSITVSLKVEVLIVATTPTPAFVFMEIASHLNVKLILKVSRTRKPNF
jgi:hypothetical protein